MGRKIAYILVVLGLALVIAGCTAATPAAPAEPAAPAAPAEPAAPAAPAEPAAAAPAAQTEQTVEIPALEAWQASAHNDAAAAAFTHWNEETPAEIPAECARCHSTSGFQDYVGADGSEAYQVDQAHAVGSTVQCTACHNEATASMSTVKFPSGAEVSGLGREAVCMTCHQGSASGASVDEAVKAANVADDDTPVAELGFTNIHYFAAAVSRYGTLVKGGYEYPGQTYEALWSHVDGVNSCTDCHDSHTLELKLDTCAGCHTGVASAEDLKNVRMISSSGDYDGDGDVKEGIYGEVDGLRAVTLAAIQAYAKDVLQKPVVYSVDAYPYFFNDTNANGTLDADEAQFPNKYASWTGRLAKAAYNYQVSMKDPGGYVHGAKYIIQLLHDSVASLNEKLPTPVDLSKAMRDDPGHFMGSSEAFRHWDADGKVPGGCAKCHSGEGLPTFLAEGVNVSVPVSDGMTCETCHNDVSSFTRHEVNTVTFPSGAKLSFGEANDANVCLQCHQGRESTVSVNRAIQGKDADVADEKLGFRNVHYFAAGATLFGAEAKGVYEYQNKEYAGPFAHVENFQTCIQCHDSHAGEPKVDACQGCHQVDDPTLIRMNSKDDYDGDGDATEGLKGEVDGLSEALYAALLVYSKDVAGTQILYSPSAYPYFFNDTNANGEADADEINGENGYKSWTPRLLQAAYNYQYAQKDTGAYIHNATYVMQALYDSIADLKTKAPAIELKGKRP